MYEKKQLLANIENNLKKELDNYYIPTVGYSAKMIN